MKIKEFFKKLAVNMRKDFGMRIISLLIALGAWFIISVSAYPTTTVTYRNIAVEVDLEGTVAERNRLSVIDMSEQTVKATIKGQRASIGGLSSSDFVAKPEITEVNDAGEYELKLNIECKDKNADFEYTVVPDKIKVSFDKIISKSFDLTADIPNIVAADGYLKGNAEVTTPSITITGPEERVNYITKCKIQNLSEMQLTESQEISEGNNLVLYHNNTVISSEGLSLSKNSFAINVPVTMRRTLPLVVSFINVPENISLEDIEYTQSVEEIEVAAPPEKIENLGEIYLCTIDLRKVTPGYTVTVPLEFTEESEMENLSQVSEVTLEFLQNLHLPQFIIDGMYINGTYYHPTFLYESLLCLLGFIILLIFRRKTYTKIGQTTSLYLIWYGIVRFFIESLRTDSLMLGPLKMAQIVSILMIIIGIIIYIVLNRASKFKNRYNDSELNENVTF